MGEVMRSMGVEAYFVVETTCEGEHNWEDPAALTLVEDDDEKELALSVGGSREAVTQLVWVAQAAAIWHMKPLYDLINEKTLPAGTRAWRDMNLNERALFLDD
jgi:hypothetical protein